MLKKYHKTKAEVKTQETEEMSKYLPSGVESPDSKVSTEMLVVVPFVRNERGEYRAIDPKTKWRGWVDFTPPTPQPEPTPEPEPAPEPTPEEAAKAEFKKGFTELRRYEVGIDKGIIEPDNAEYLALKAKLKTDFKAEYLDLLL